jgi:hypothetical protein
MQVFRKFSPKYIFPLLLILVLLILTVLRISGSSIGPFYDFYLDGKPSSSLLRNHHRGVRTDEWLVTTQLTIAQKQAGYPRVNPNIGEGKDMSLISDVPYKEWSTAFKSQNWSFFVMPFENAFAFKWWFLLVSLMLSIYFVALRFLRARYVVAALVAIIGSATPFIFWWYQAITIMPIVWIFVTLLLVLRLLDRRSFGFVQSHRHGLLITNSLLAAGIAYGEVAFALILYPAFQVPLAIVVGLFAAGYITNRTLIDKQGRVVLQAAKYVGLATLVAFGIVGIFLATRLEPVHAIRHTVYPGARDIISGDIGPKQLINFIGLDQYKLLDDNVQTSIPSNQSEVSSFLVLSIIFVIPFLWYLFKRWRSKLPTDWIAIGILAANAVLLGHMFLHLFTPLSKLLLLNTVPQVRLYIAFGCLGTLSLIYLLHIFGTQVRSRPVFPRFLLPAYAGLVVICTLGVILYLRQTYPTYFTVDTSLWIALLVYGLGLGILFTRRYVYGLLVLALFSLFMVRSVQPLYLGLGDAYSGKLVSAIRQTSGKDASWGVEGDYVLENMPMLAGQRDITGIQFYPDNHFWHQANPKASDFTYNRYAHVMLAENLTQPLHLVQADYFQANVRCGNFVTDHLTNILTTREVTVPCFSLEKTLRFDTRTIYIYKKTSV